MADNQTIKSLKTCKICGSEFPAGGGNQWSKEKLYCSKVCSDKSPKLNGEIRKCEGCGVEFQKRRRAKDAGRYCSRECWHARIKTEPTYTPIIIEPCAICSAMWCRRKSAAYNACSEACRRVITLDAARAYYQAHVVSRPTQMQCTECGGPFAPSARGRTPEYCSQRCGSRVAKRIRRTLEAKGSIGDPVRYAEVYDRCNGTCQLCGIKVDRKAAPATPLQGTIDHVQPISLHGKHCADNVQLAHYYCNTLKSNMLIVSDTLRALLIKNVTAAWSGLPVSWKTPKEGGGAIAFLNV